MATEKSYFSVLNAIDCGNRTEVKDCGNGVKLTYLSWAWAWGIAKSNFPDATYCVYENADGWNYFTDGKTCWVKTGVTINGIEHIEYLPVMDYRNRSILLKDVTSFDVNKAIQRSLTKAIARHGLGLYIYAGEDIPSEADDTLRSEVNGKATTAPRRKAKAAPAAEEEGDLGIFAAMDELDRVKSRAALEAADRSWRSVYGKEGSMPNTLWRKKRAELELIYPDPTK